MEGLRVIAGLGNPGVRYEQTRHNAGFMVVDRLRERENFSPWSRWQACLKCQGELEGERVWLIKPQSFMNLSGEPVRDVCRYSQVEPENLIVVHDDLDLPLGSLRVRLNGGDGGHNGLRSLESSLGSSAFYRVRVGVGRPGQGEVIDWVLGRFDGEQAEILRSTIECACDALVELVARGLSTAQNKFNS